MVCEKLLRRDCLLIIIVEVWKVNADKYKKVGGVVLVWVCGEAGVIPVVVCA